MNNKSVLIGLSVAAAVVVGLTTFYLKQKKTPRGKSTTPLQSESSTLTGIFYYPVKSCRGIAAQTANIGRLGFENDRQRMVINGETNRFVTQRQIPKLALITTEIKDNYLLLNAPNMETLKIPLNGFDDATGGKLRQVGVWSDDCEGLDEGDLAAQWIQTFLQTPNLRLVRTPDNHNRKIDDQYQVQGTENVVSYADGFPFLLISEGSLRELNSRIGNGSDLPMNRFRPNLVVSGAAFVEDTWKKIKIGNVILDLVKPCSRCKLTTVDQSKGEFGGIEPLNTLKTFRTGLIKTAKEEACFGQNGIHENLGSVSVGQTIEILEYYDGETVVVNN